MTEGDLEEYVTGVREHLERSPEMNHRETDLRVVLPLLRTLGWDIHSESVVPDYAVETDDGRATVDYALCLDDVPVAFVVAVQAGTELDPDHGKRLTAAMEAAGVDWGLATNGHSFAFVTHEGDEERRVGCDLPELPDNATVVGHYARSAAVERREERAREVRRDVAGELADDRSTVVDRVGTAVTDGVDAPDHVESELLTASEAFVDGVLDALSAGRHPAEFAPEGNVTDEAHVADAASTDDDDPADGSGDQSAEAADGEPPETASSGDEASVRNVTEEGSVETEYVVRFFNGRSSVGAVGHSTYDGAMAQAVEYMIEQHGLDSSLDLPWGVEEGTALVNYDPVHPDGTEMDASEQLSNGYYLNTALDANAGRALVEKLADKTGLRVMFRGDWP